MELKSGYKQTEIGAIPEDWQLSTIGEVCSFENGDRSSNYPSQEDFSATGVPFINAGHVSNGSIDTTSIDCIKEVVFNKLTRGKVKPGDVLYCLRGSLGKFGLVMDGFGEGAIASSLVIIRTKVNKLTIKYFISFLASDLCEQMIDIWAGGAAQPNLGVQDLARFVIPMPSINEQKVIAEALGDADALVESLERLIAKKRQIKQGTMQELITGRRRLPGFSGVWSVKCLGVCLLASPDYGINAPAVSYSDRLPAYIRITDITDEGRFAPSPLVSVAHPNAENYCLSEGDLVFARTGASVGKSYLYKDSDGALVFAGFLIRVRPDASVLDSTFLSYLVQTDAYWDWVKLMSMRSGQPGINGKEFSQLPLNIPPITEQSAISSTLSEMDNEITSLETQLQKARHLKQGMMQELLTGRIRLV